MTPGIRELPEVTGSPGCIRTLSFVGRLFLGFITAQWVSQALLFFPGLTCLPVSYTEGSLLPRPSAPGPRAPYSSKPRRLSDPAAHRTPRLDDIMEETAFAKLVCQTDPTAPLLGLQAMALAASVLLRRKTVTALGSSRPQKEPVLLLQVPPPPMLQPLLWPFPSRILRSHLPPCSLMPYLLAPLPHAKQQVRVLCLQLF